MTDRIPIGSRDALCCYKVDQRLVFAIHGDGSWFVAADASPQELYNALIELSRIYYDSMRTKLVIS